MSARRPPGLDPRRESEFRRQLLERARQWIPAWAMDENHPDFAQALLAVAARFQGEVAERLDKGGDKMALGFLDWLAVRGQAAVPARMPVVFKLADKAAAIDAPAPVQLTVDAGGTQVVFETESSVRLLPASLQMVVAADSAKDEYYLPPPGLSSLEPLEPLPTEWTLRSFAAPGSTTLQLDPPLGLKAEMVLDLDGQEFRIVSVNEDLVGIDPPIPASVQFEPATTRVRKVGAFDPFNQRTRNRQSHALYLGHSDLLNIASEAVIKIAALSALGNDVQWHYWGMTPNAAAPAWLPFEPGSNADALRKPRGSMEELQIGALTSRWIRASIAKVQPPAHALSYETIELLVNPADLTGACTAPGGGVIDVEGVVAMANTTPLELKTTSFPLGREPRQFDAFYLGSDEAFSKHGAKVRVCVDMADPSFICFAALRAGDKANQLLAGVAQDGHLHLLSFTPSNGRLLPYREPLQPPSPMSFGQPAEGLPVALDAPATFRPALWSQANPLFGRDVTIAVSAGASVWAWREIGFIPSFSGWTSLGTVNATPGIGAIQGLVYLAAGAAGNLFALLDGALYVRDPNGSGTSWAPVPVDRAGTPVKLEQIAPVITHDGDLGVGTMAEGLLAVGVDRNVYSIVLVAAPAGLAGHATVLFTQALPSVAPAGLRRDDAKLLVVAACETGPGHQLLRAYLQGTIIDAHLEDGATILPCAIDVNQSSGQLGFAASLQLSGGASAIGWWSSDDGPLPEGLLVTTVPDGLGTAAGSPTLLAQHIVVPARSGQVLVAQFNLALRRTFFTYLACAVVTPLSDQRLAKDDRIAITIGAGAYALRKILVDDINNDREMMYVMDDKFGALQVGDDLLVYRTSTAGLAATVSSTIDKIDLPATDTQTAMGDILAVDDNVTIDLYIVTDVTAGVATLDRDMNAASGDGIAYWRPEPAIGKARPLMKLNPTTNGNWDATLLDRTLLTFPDATPLLQHGTAFATDAGRPTLVVLEKEFTAVPTPAKFIVDGSIDKWSSQPEDIGTNPELSWEYWNGSAWWKLSGLTDGTGNLKRSGAIRFDIPADMQSTDWAGTTSHWIRARLIGGDYGQPRTVVKTVPGPNGTVEQTVQRFPDEVNAPQVLRLRVQYAVNTPVAPTYVLTADGGALRDQSDANSTDGALVTIFTPLADALPAATGASAGAEPVRALYLGFSGALAGQPVNLLALVEREQQLGAFAPMRIEALSGEHFIPVAAEDSTRALGESGLLSLSLSLPTVTAALFGRPLCWLRLSPSQHASADGWTPALRGLYLNAVWARASETMTRERLGSSTGAPGQAFLLARPPVLHASLELRVREPLSIEEREALLRADRASVVSDVASDLPGHWVRWRQVADVDDAGPLDRVYALDEASGEVRFGDAVHGAIPPIGRDAIVAFSYRRTEAGAQPDAVPANGIAPRTSLNLVTPLEGVEAAFAADQSAGGSPPESTERVRRFASARLRHRGRVVTLPDFEAYALQSSPDIAQARAWSDGGVRLLIAMRGKEVLPSQAVKRELRRALLAVAAPHMAVGQALRIEGPVLRRLRISVALTVETLAGSGQLADYVKATLSAFFDPALGGLGRQGWPLGADPAEDDIALALLDAPGLEGLDSIVFEEIKDDGSAVIWPHTVRRNELVVLDQDGVRIDFIIMEAEL
ncbi:hypothetical protein [Duganella sp. HH101]|uniref:hypothetical protein n=1 Tax=Duganella sp. HH101 TaxID=1781066 RepID=UPI00089339BA|nr:hypothetical protein [Duganella sp. HH101]OFA06908.1 hypothetical protein DUGA2_02400 [Duganella sp. HH101]